MSIPRWVAVPLLLDCAECYYLICMGEREREVGRGGGVKQNARSFRGKFLEEKLAQTQWGKQESRFTLGTDMCLRTTGRCEKSTNGGGGGGGHTHCLVMLHGLKGRLGQGDWL